MTHTEALNKFLATRQHDLPWETGTEEVTAIFMAGWKAHEESLKQSALPLAMEEGTPPTETVTVRLAPDYDAVYAAYPRKVGRANALKAIEKAVATIAKRENWSTPTAAEWLRIKTSRYAVATSRWPSADKQFIPHAATWFNRGSYDDDESEWVRVNGGGAVSQFSKKV